jgi:hypothetical protein
MLDASRFSLKALDQTAGVTGKDVDTEASAEERTATAESWAAKAPNASLTTFTDSPAAKSKRALNTILSTLDDCLPDMSPDDKAGAYTCFVRHPQMIGIERKVA